MLCSILPQVRRTSLELIRAGQDCSGRSIRRPISGVTRMAKKKKGGKKDGKKKGGKKKKK
jgi:hypothetical protein